MRYSERRASRLFRNCLLHLAVAAAIFVALLTAQVDPRLAWVAGLFTVSGGAQGVAAARFGAFRTSAASTVFYDQTLTS